MNIEIKIQFTDMASAIAFLARRPEAPAGAINYAAAVADVDPVAEVSQTPTQEVKTEGKRGPGRPPKAAKESESAAPAAAASAAKPQESASTPPVDEVPVFVKPAAEAPAKLKTYEETDFAERIMKLVADQKETGNKSKVEALKAALGALGLKSARELKPEQLGAFGEKLAEIEALATEDALG